MTTERAIEVTTDGSRIHVRIWPPFPGAAPLSPEEAEELTRQLLAVLPPRRAASVAREALALDAVRAAEGAQADRAVRKEPEHRENERDNPSVGVSARPLPTNDHPALAALAAQHVRGGRLTFTRLDGDDVRIDDPHEGSSGRSWTGTLAHWEQALVEAVRERDGS